MQNDKTTLKDLSIFPTDGSGGVFALMDRATTQAGRDMLRRHIYQAPATWEQLRDTQDAIKYWTKNSHKWPVVISNGTLVMLEKFFESSDQGNNAPSGITLVLGAFFQKMLHRRQYFFTQFTLSHLADLLRGCTELSALAAEPDVPTLLKKELESIHTTLQHHLTPAILSVHKNTPYSELARLNYLARRDMKNMAQRLINSYALLDAWQSMARAGAEHGWVFPEIMPSGTATIKAKGMRHPLLERAVSYDVTMDEHHRLMVLTGANMSGKTTFMRALGVSALMAHLGMAVPATDLRMGFLHGVITNMHVEDNLLKGESYFFAEVLRMKHTATQLLQQGAHLVLMDELFKGTNVHDAYECTRAVMEGLLKHKNHLMVLSTHLYEVAHIFKDRDDIVFAYFVTNLATDGSYRFTYELKQGISDDRIGYRILQREGVIALLNDAGHQVGSRL